MPDVVNVASQALALSTEAVVAAADGSNARQVTHLGKANWAPFFAPDGRRIIYASNAANPRGNNFDLFGVAWQYRWGGGL